MTEREENLLNVIDGLIANIRAKHKAYGNEYQGGMPINVAIREIERMGFAMDQDGKFSVK